MGAPGVEQSQGLGSSRKQARAPSVVQSQEEGECGGSYHVETGDPLCPQV